jgi:ribosomal protein S27E
VLHELVAQHAQTMFAELRDADPDGGGLARYVERELAAYLKCGIPAHGFARVRCQTCRDEIVVAFSCKSRGICPSCTAQRMAGTHPMVARALLGALDLPHKPTVFAPARDPPQAELAWDDPA